METEKKTISIEYLNNEIEDLKKQLIENQEQAKSLQKKLAQIGSDINAIDGALQQCEKMKSALEISVPMKLEAADGK